MNNMAVVQTINRQGSSRSDELLDLAEEIFPTGQQKPHQHPGQTRERGAKRLGGCSLEVQGHLSRVASMPGMFSSLKERYGSPQIDLFASDQTTQLREYLTMSHKTKAGGPDALTEDWNRGSYIYLFPPPVTLMLHKIILKFRRFRGKVLLIAPFWTAQPWFHQLIEWCPQPLMLIIVSVGPTSSPTPDIAKTTRLEFLKHGLLKNYSRESVETMLAAHRPSTIRQYESCWKRFQVYLKLKHITNLRPNDVLDFLSWLTTTTLNITLNITLPQRPMALLQKGIRAQRPSQRGPVLSWSLHKVLNYLTFTNADLSLDQRLQRVVFLTALATGFRSSQLAALTRHPSFTFFNEDGLWVSLTPSPKFIAKTKHQMN